MTKTQIQVPEALHRELKRFAKAREWSLAETFRRGAELLLEVYAADPAPQGESWSPPVSTDVGWKNLTPEELRDAVFDDSEPGLTQP